MAVKIIENAAVQDNIVEKEKKAAKMIPLHPNLVGSPDFFWIFKDKTLYLIAYVLVYISLATHVWLLWN